ncbi:unnamed protein product [Brassica napus]|uniref:(rape) hypothetical protein n=1 Tax=Brassica napus TaxID=3708 RepID=A0A816UNU0_BRANA|nr:unnamed protein product [Brassica napus]
MKLTCKQCKTLIEDPNFVEKHFSRMRGREQQLTVITEASPDANSSSSLSSSSGFKVSCMGIDFNRLKKPCLNIKVFVPRSLVKAVFECDGLLVWVMEHNLLILNPLLRRGTIVPVPPPCCGYDYCNYAYGLGYPWNEVFDKIFDGFFNVPMSSVCFRGTPYWIGICKRGTIYSIQSFDFERECFEPLLLPPTTFEWGDSLSLGVFKVDYISLLHRSSLTGEIHLSHSVSLTPTKQSKSLSLRCSNNGDNISSPKDTPIELTFPTVMDINQIREILPHRYTLISFSLRPVFESSILLTCSVFDS